MLDDFILALDDAAASRVLESLTQAYCSDVEADSAEFAEVLAKVSPGDLARTSLVVLARDPRFQKPLAAILAGPMPESFGLVTAAVVITAAVFVLKTHLLIEKDRDGFITLKIESKPLPAKVIQVLAESLVGLSL